MNPTSEVEIASSTPLVDQGKLQDFCPSPEVTVCATTATLNSRYDLKETTVTLLHSIDIPVSYGTTYLAAGIASSNLVPQGWVQHIHPEGSVYYVNTDLNVVTDASICNVTVFRKIRAALVTVFFSLQNAKALPKDHEIYIHATSDSDICHYYMIDHDNCVEFWLQGHASSELCLPPAVSVSHLKYALQEHYWIHREYFPHRPVPDRLRQELVNVLQHGKGDQMTSFASTFVLSAAQCSEFIQMIDIETSKCNNPQMTHMIARLWTLVSRHRFDHFYGHDYARVSREQRRLVKPARADSVLFKVICSLFFRFPDAKVEELENLLTDHIVYGIHWKPFAAEQLSDWEKSSTKAVALLIANTVFLLSCKTYPVVYCGLASTATSVGSLFVAQLLTSRHSGLDKMTPSAAASFLRSIEHDTFGFVPVAAFFSAPDALLVWSIILISTETCGLILERMASQTALMISVVAISSLCAVVIVSQHSCTMRSFLVGIAQIGSRGYDSEPAFSNV